MSNIPLRVNKNSKIWNIYQKVEAMDEHQPDKIKPSDKTSYSRTKNLKNQRCQVMVWKQDKTDMFFENRKTLTAEKPREKTSIQWNPGVINSNLFTISKIASTCISPIIDSYTLLIPRLWFFLNIKSYSNDTPYCLINHAKNLKLFTILTFPTKNPDIDT